MTKKYDTEPKHAKALEQRLRNRADQGSFLRARRELANVAVIKALTTPLDLSGEPVFAVKGGVALELQFGFEARATTDLDVGFRAATEDLETRLLDSLAAGWRSVGSRSQHLTRANWGLRTCRDCLR